MTKPCGTSCRFGHTCTLATFSFEQQHPRCLSRLSSFLFVVPLVVAFAFIGELLNKLHGVALARLSRRRKLEPSSPNNRMHKIHVWMHHETPLRTPLQDSRDVGRRLESHMLAYTQAHQNRPWTNICSRLLSTRDCAELWVVMSIGNYLVMRQLGS